MCAPRLLLRPLLTSRSAAGIATLRRPFRREARSPQVRTMAFPAQPPDLRRSALVVRASRSTARSPCSAAPPIRFLFVGSTGSLPRFFQRSPHGRRFAARFGPYDQVPGGLSPPDHRPYWAHSGKGQAAVSGPPVLFVFARSDPTRNRGGLTVSTLTGTAPRTIARRSGLIDTPGGSVRRLRIFLLALLAPRHPMARAGAVQQRIAMPLQRLGGRLRRRPVGLPGLLSLLTSRPVFAIRVHATSPA